MVLKTLTEQEAKVLRKRFGIVIARDGQTTLGEEIIIDISEICSMCGDEEMEVQKFFNGKHTIIICGRCLKSVS